jgi:hypothetical protein
METVGAADQENKRKPARAGSVPPRATTPVNSLHAYIPGAKTGVVTPAVRHASASQSVPNKRQRVGEPSTAGHQRQGSGGNINAHAPSYGNAPLGTHRGGNVRASGRAVSPSKPPGKTPNARQQRSATMPIPKPGTQHHTLGHGRVPTALGFAGGTTAGPRSVSSIAGLTSSVYGRRQASGGSGYAAAGAMKKATRARRESFKPRPSIDDCQIGMGGGRWAGLAGSVMEEDEGC